MKYMRPLHSIFWIALSLVLSHPSQVFACFDLFGSCLPQGPSKPLKTEFTISKVRISKKNSFGGFRHKYENCVDNFQGTQEGNKIYIQIKSSGGRGKHRHFISYDLSDSYDLKSESAGHREQRRSGDGEIKIQLPDLKSTVPFVQQTIQLVTEDADGNRTSFEKFFKVSHVVQLQKVLPAKSCFETFLPVSTGIKMGNQTTEKSTLSIKQTTGTSNTKSQSHHFGVFVNPIAGFPPGFFLSLFSLNYEYFTEVSQQTNETTEYDQQFSISPESNAEIYRQDTRFVTAYEVARIGACGEAEILTDNEESSPFLIQTWSHAFHAVILDPNAPVVLESVGAKVENTCPDQYSQKTRSQNIVSESDPTGGEASNEPNMEKVTFHRFH